MSIHTCTRCGHEIGCSHGSWHDRHPYAAVLFAVPAFIVSLGAIAAYSWLFVPLLAIGSAVYAVDREHRHRQALAARADYEHRALMAAPLRWPAPPERSRFIRDRDVRCRSVDHWSPTRPIRMSA